jgi:TolA-binding protein
MTRVQRPLSPRSQLGRLTVVLAALLLAPAAHAQLGIDLSAPPAPKKEKKGAKKAPAKPAPKKPAAPARDDERIPGLDPAPDRAAPEAPPAPPARSDAVPARPEPRGEETVLPGLDLGKTAPSGEAKARLDAAKKLFAEKATETAALAFDGILREPGLASVHDEARYQLGKALARLGLHHSALSTFDAILDRGAGSKFYGSAMEWLFYVGRRLKNEQPLLSRVARHAREAFPPGYEDKFHFLLAKYEFERGRALQDAGRGGEARAAWGEARRLASLVREQAGATPAPAPGGEAPPEDEGDLFAKARFVDGLIRYAEGDDQGATVAFKDVVRLTNPKRGRRADPELRELSFLQLARIHYQNRQNRYAIFYYGKMPWGGESWLEGLWEASYAHYRVGDYEKTLGNLLTLQSPYF